MSPDQVQEDRLQTIPDESNSEPPQASHPPSSAEPLSITLPDGSESVSEAILSHRRMLTNPAENGLVASAELEAVRENVKTLSNRLPDELNDELTTLETSIQEVETRLDHQRREIEELQTAVTSLAEILGTSVGFQSGDEGA